MASTYSYGDKSLERSSANDEGIISRLVNPIDARSCLRLGDADARMMRLLRRRVRAGSSKGGGGLGGIRADDFGDDGGLDNGEGFEAASYDGGGSAGSGGLLMSDIVDADVQPYRRGSTLTSISKLTNLVN